MPCYSEPTPPDYLTPRIEDLMGFLLEVKVKTAPASIKPREEREEDRYRIGKLLDEEKKKILDEYTRRLCKHLKECEDVTQYSLEMQIWWRDHQKFDEKRRREGK